jgi:hypothetical protein
MILSLLESGLARLGWIVVCAHCKRRLPYGTPPAYCHACFYGTVTPEKTWEPHA